MTLPVSISPVPGVDLSHHRIHEGNHFAVHRISKGLAAAVPKYFLIIPPSTATIPSDTIKVHLLFEIESNNEVTAEFFEDSSVSGNGTPILLRNNDRNSDTTSSVTVFEDPVPPLIEGISIFEEIGTDVGELLRDEDEIILKVGSLYLLKITPSLGATNITTEFNWYDQRPSSPSPIL